MRLRSAVCSALAVAALGRVRIRVAVCSALAVAALGRVRIRVAVCSALAVAALGGCGFGVRSGDDFLLTRVGEGSRLTLLVNDGGTIRCNGSMPIPISNSLLLAARDLVVNLDSDAKRGLAIASTGTSVYGYTIRMQDGTVSFPDTAAGTRHEFAGAEEFVLRALAGPCRGYG